MLAIAASGFQASVNEGPSGMVAFSATNISAGKCKRKWKQLLSIAAENKVWDVSFVWAIAIFFSGWSTILGPSAPPGLPRPCFYNHMFFSTRPSREDTTFSCAFMRWWPLSSVSSQFNALTILSCDARLQPRVADGEPSWPATVSLLMVVQEWPTEVAGDIGCRRPLDVYGDHPACPRVGALACGNPPHGTTRDSPDQQPPATLEPVGPQQQGWQQPTATAHHKACRAKVCHLPPASHTLLDPQSVPFASHAFASTPYIPQSPHTRPNTSVCCCFGGPVCYSPCP